MRACYGLTAVSKAVKRHGRARRQSSQWVSHSDGQVRTSALASRISPRPCQLVSMHGFAPACTWFIVLLLGTARMSFGFQGFQPLALQVKKAPLCMYAKRRRRARAHLAFGALIRPSALGMEGARRGGAAPTASGPSAEVATGKLPDAIWNAAANGETVTVTAWLGGGGHVDATGRSHHIMLCHASRLEHGRTVGTVVRLGVRDQQNGGGTLYPVCRRDQFSWSCSVCTAVRDFEIE